MFRSLLQEFPEFTSQFTMFTLLSLLLIGLSATFAVEYPIHAGPVYHAPAAYAKPLVKAVEYEAPAHYEFSYSVHDDHTGDIKSQKESRKDDQVHGQYTLVDADGFLRTVDYTSDAHNGFNAIVRREPLGHEHHLKAKAIYTAPKLLAAPKIPLGHYAYAH